MTQAMARWWQVLNACVLLLTFISFPCANLIFKKLIYKVDHSNQMTHLTSTHLPTTVFLFLSPQFQMHI